jgi:hypothetical protein
MIRLTGEPPVVRQPPSYDTEYGSFQHDEARGAVHPLDGRSSCTVCVVSRRLLVFVAARRRSAGLDIQLHGDLGEKFVGLALLIEGFLEDFSDVIFAG